MKCLIKTLARIGNGGRTIVLIVCLGTSATIAKAMDFTTDFEVDISKYAGLWYEIGRTPNSYQDNRPRRKGERYSACFNTTAEYQTDGSGRIKILNSCSRDTASGASYRETAVGVGKIIKNSKQRKLQVAFGPGVARFMQRLFGSSQGNYWIYCLGSEIDDRYSWAVVSNEDKENLYFLARDQFPDEQQMNAMMQCARDEGLPISELKYFQRR